MSERQIGLRLASRRQLDRQARKLSDWLDGWDPIGVYPPSPPTGSDEALDAEVDEGPPPGEYDCMVWPLIGLLHRQAPHAEVREWLRRELDEHFGLPEQGDLDQVVERLQQWWRDLDQAPEVLEPPLAAALVERRLLPPEETPWLAAHWLVAGLDSPALRELAGLGRRDPETTALWRTALVELQVVPTAEDDRGALLWAARQVAAGRMPARDLVSAFWPDYDVRSEFDAVVYALDEALERGGNQREFATERPTGWRRLLRRPPQKLYKDDPADDAERAVQALADGNLAEARRLLGII